MKLLLFISFICPVLAGAQLTIEEIRLKPGSEFHKSKDANIIYPVISTKNKDIDKKINNRIIEELTGEEKTNISKALMDQMSEGLTELDYHITLKTKDLLSLKLSALGCGAYCSSWYVYFNFDLTTGETIGIEDVINKSDLDSFRSMVFRDKLKSLKKDKEGKDKLLAQNEIDSSTYEFVMDYVKANCISEARIEIFSLSPGGLEIIDRCELPHVARAYEPEYELKYSYRKLQAFINLDIAKRLKSSSSKY